MTKSESSDWGIAVIVAACLIHSVVSFLVIAVNVPRFEKVFTHGLTSGSLLALLAESLLLLSRYPLVAGAILFIPPVVVLWKQQQLQGWCARHAPQRYVALGAALIALPFLIFAAALVTIFGSAFSIPSMIR